MAASAAASGSASGHRTTSNSSVANRAAVTASSATSTSSTSVLPVNSAAAPWRVSHVTRAAGNAAWIAGRKAVVRSTSPVAASLTTSTRWRIGSYSSQVAQTFWRCLCGAQGRSHRTWRQSGLKEGSVKGIGSSPAEVRSLSAGRAVGWNRSPLYLPPMTALVALWLPILLSAVFVFVVSSVMHMALPWHRGDYKKLPDEDATLDGLRATGVLRGQYMFPCAGSMKEMGSPEMQAKLQRGPIGVIIVRGAEGASMGRALVQWFVFCLVIGICTACR
jgi:hypothetical protein